MTHFEQQTLNLLLNESSSSNPISGKKIAELIGLPARPTGREGADMRQIIHEIRLAGFPICADDRGYFYAKTKEELKDFIKGLENRIASQQEIVEALKKSFKAVENPQAKIKQLEESKMREFSQLSL